MKSLAPRSALTILGALLLIGPPGGSAAPAPVTKAVAVVNALGSSGVTGRVVFTKAAAGVRVSVTLSGLKPGEHGFHVHEFGDCSAPDGTSAGAHFNPGGEPHAGPHDAQRHAGDLGNVRAGSDGSVNADYVDAKLALEGPTSILGRAVIVHVAADDLKTQPTGNAGGRLACGLIGVAKPE